MRKYLFLWELSAQSEPGFTVQLKERPSYGRLSHGYTTDCAGH